jgi:hypothetical protein
MLDQFIHLFERSFVEKQFDAFAGGELAFAVLPFAALRPSAFIGGGVAAAHFFESVHKKVMLQV